MDASEWRRYEQLAEVTNVVIFLAVWHAATEGNADWHARNNGAPGTCSETGIFLAESGGNWQAENPTSTASGGFQAIDGTWNGYGGYSHASHAPPSVQHDWFHMVWADGAGRSHWAASVC